MTMTDPSSPETPVTPETPTTPETPGDELDGKLALAHARVKAILDEMGLHYQCTITDGERGVVFAEMPVDTSKPTPEEALEGVPADDVPKIATITTFLLDSALSHVGRNLMLCSALAELISSGKAPKVSAMVFSRQMFTSLGRFANTFDETLAMAKKHHDDMEALDNEMNRIMTESKTPGEAIAAMTKFMRDRRMLPDAATATPPAEEKAGAA